MVTGGENGMQRTGSFSPADTRCLLEESVPRLFLKIAELP